MGVYFRFGHWKYCGWMVRHESVLSTLSPIVLRSGIYSDRTLVFPLSNVIALHACFVCLFFQTYTISFSTKCSSIVTKAQISALVYSLIKYFVLRKTKLMRSTINDIVAFWAKRNVYFGII